MRQDSILKKYDTAGRQKICGRITPGGRHGKSSIYRKRNYDRKGRHQAVEAGVDAIVVSNHGGRVLDQCPATAEVLPAIVEAVQGKVKIFVDGGIRSGVDVFKALALGADGVLICRPFVTAVYGGGMEGVKTYIEKIGAELADTMAMCGANSLKEITKEIHYIYGWQKEYRSSIHIAGIPLVHINVGKGPRHDGKFHCAKGIIANRQ
mgnify:CR=1 FL=1